MLDYLLAAQSDDKPMVEDVFSTTLYTGIGTQAASSSSIAGGVNISAPADGSLLQGGLTWVKGRSSAQSNILLDTLRGQVFPLRTESSAASTENTGLFLTLGNGQYRLSSDTTINTNGATYALWTFRRARKFFDVVTWTGDGVAGRQIAHGLSVAPGMIIVKRTNAVSNWLVYHRTTGGAQYIPLNLTSTAQTDATVWNNTNPTASVFTVGTSSEINLNGASYIAYLFAHDPDPTGIIQCGSFTTDSSGNATVNLGWEPQWAVFKASSATGNWMTFDEARGWVTDAAVSSAFLAPNLTSAEAATTTYRKASNGMTFTLSATPSTTYIYMAIRRGPMRTPTDATKVFSLAALPTGSATWPPDQSDMLLSRFGRNASNNTYITDNLRGYGSAGSPLLKTNLTDAEAAPTTSPRAYRTESLGSKPTITLDLGGGTSGHVVYGFKRAPGFFDQVCYTGDGTDNRVLSHNLGAVPTFIWIKSRSNAQPWAIWHQSVGYGLQLDTTVTGYNYFYAAGITDKTIGVRTTSPTNGSGMTYTAYLFGDVPGVSATGSYTGTGSDVTVSCGFSPRFVLLKRTDLAQSWIVFDTTRGIVAAADPALQLNATTAEASADYIDPVAGGFIALAAANLSPIGGTYLYYCIA